MQMLRRYRFISIANVVFSGFLLLVISLSILGYVFAATPNPGHDFTAIGGGVLQGDLLYGTTTDTLAALPKNTSATRYLSNIGLNNNPAWAQVDLASGVTSTLSGINGGTGNSFMTFIGPLISLRTFTLPNASATILTDAAAVTVTQGGTGLSSLTANNVILGNGTGTVLFVAPGSDGNILQSNGTTWISAAGGVLNGRQTLTASGTYTPTVGTKEIEVRLWGGGGAGGGCTAAAGCAGGGGGSGGYAEYYFVGVTSTNPFTIGAGGKGVTGAGGQAASSTTFTIGGVTVTAFGGLGGTFTAGTAAIKFTAGGAGSVISTFGNVNTAGVPGGSSMTSTVTTVVSSGAGGSTVLGGGGAPKVNISSAGSNAIANTGAGGSGAAAIGAVANAGGNGADGLIVITEYR